MEDGRGEKCKKKSRESNKNNFRTIKVKLGKLPARLGHLANDRANRFYLKEQEREGEGEKEGETRTKVRVCVFAERAATCES